MVHILAIFALYASDVWLTLSHGIIFWKEALFTLLNGIRISYHDVFRSKMTWMNDIDSMQKIIWSLHQMQLILYVNSISIFWSHLKYGFF